VGTLIGGYAGWNATEHWIIGAYYEDRIGKFESNFNENYYVVGGFLDYVILREKRLDLSVMGRFGYKSGRFLFIVPQLIAGYRVNHFLEMNFFATIRSEFPAVGISAFTNFNFKK
jgi:hypothetical protein